MLPSRIRPTGAYKSFKCFYSSKHVRGFFKTVAWSIWLICLGLLFFIARDNAILHKQQNINRYVHAYYSDNAEVMMELEGIDMMFSDLEIKPIPVKEYREYLKERKKGQTLILNIRVRELNLSKHLQKIHLLKIREIRSL